MSQTARQWIARILVLAVFASNMYCALTFVLNPASFTGAYQITGPGAPSAIAGMGVVFAMWNATYPPVIALPDRFPVLFGVVIAQQVIGLAGESWIYSTLGPSQAILSASIMRFIVFDAIGLVLLAIACYLSFSRRGAWPTSSK